MPIGWHREQRWRGWFWEARLCSESFWPTCSRSTPTTVHSSQGCILVNQCFAGFRWRCSQSVLPVKLVYWLAFFHIFKALLLLLEELVSLLWNFFLCSTAPIESKASHEEMLRNLPTTGNLQHSFVIWVYTQRSMTLIAEICHFLTSQCFGSTAGMLTRMIRGASFQCNCSDCRGLQVCSFESQMSSLPSWFVLFLICVFPGKWKQSIRRFHWSSGSVSSCFLIMLTVFQLC
jgi:hypothetical protein